MGCRHLHDSFKYPLLYKLLSAHTLFIHSVPVPMVTVTLSHTRSLYSGSSLTFTCTVTLDPNVDYGRHEKVVTEWSGLQDIPEERYSVTTASGSGNTYTGSLTISPLAYQDTGTYTCIGTVTDAFNEVTASDNISITVKSEFSSQ